MVAPRRDPTVVRRAELRRRPGEPPWALRARPSTARRPRFRRRPRGPTPERGPGSRRPPRPSGPRTDRTHTRCAPGRPAGDRHMPSTSSRWTSLPPGTRVFPSAFSKRALPGRRRGDIRGRPLIETALPRRRALVAGASAAEGGTSRRRSLLLSVAVPLRTHTQTHGGRLGVTRTRTFRREREARGQSRGGGVANPHASTPPSTTMVVPVTYAAAGVARKAIVAATSSGRPSRPSGTVRAACSAQPCP